MDPDPAQAWAVGVGRDRQVRPPVVRHREPVQLRGGAVTHRRVPGHQQEGGIDPDLRCDLHVRAHEHASEQPTEPSALQRPTAEPVRGGLIGKEGPAA